MAAHDDFRVRRARGAFPGGGEVILRTIHEMDEDIFQARRNLLPGVRFPTIRRDGALQRNGILAADMQRGAESHGLLDAGLVANLVREGEQVRTADRPGGQADMVNHFLDGPMGEQVAVGDVGEPMATFGFIHVVRGNEKGEPFAGQQVDLLPKIAPRLGVHARGRFVEEQELRLMDEARSQGETLLPAAGKLPGQLLLPAGQAELLEAFLHGFAPVFQTIHARDEIEVFSDAQILPKAEALRHVANLPLDQFALRDDVVTEAGAAAGIGMQ